MTALSSVRKKQFCDLVKRPWRGTVQRGIHGKARKQDFSEQNICVIMISVVCFTLSAIVMLWLFRAYHYSACLSVILNEKAKY